MKALHLSDFKAFSRNTSDNGKTLANNLTNRAYPCCHKAGILEQRLEQEPVPRLAIRKTNIYYLNKLR